MTRDRVGAGLATVAAVTGLVLVLHDHQRGAGPSSAPTSAAIDALGG